MTWEEVRSLVHEIFDLGSRRNVVPVEYAFRYTVFSLHEKDYIVRYVNELGKFKCYVDDHNPIQLPIRITFEKFYESCPPEIQKRLLFHLDLFE